MIVLALRDLAAGRGARVLVPPLCLSLAGGEALAVRGANGAGKSTLLRTLAGLLPPLSGRIEFSGLLDPNGEPFGRLADASHYLGHRNGLKPTRRVDAELGFWRDFLGRPALSIAEALHAVDLPDVAAVPVGALSAGQQRRIAMARLLVSHRPVWILDEPTTALDRTAQARFSALCATHLANGGIVIAATHQPLGFEARELELATPVPPPRAIEASAESSWDEIW